VTDTKTLNVGDPAPDFTLKSIGLKEVSLHDYRGKNVVILSTRSTGLPAEASACPPSTSA
jgi:peroxiredoxin